MADPSPSRDLPDESEALVIPRFSHEEEEVSSSHGPFPACLLLSVRLAANRRALCSCFCLSSSLISGQELMGMF